MQPTHMNQNGKGPRQDETTQVVTRIVETRKPNMFDPSDEYIYVRSDKAVLNMMFENGCPTYLVIRELK